MAFPETQVCDAIEPGKAPSLPARAASPPGRLRNWQFGTVAVLTLLLGFAFRFYAAFGTYLNPDEVLHDLISARGTVGLVYDVGLTSAHPPLFYIVLHFWEFLGRTEWMLRFPSVLAGTAFCWFVYKWIEVLFGRTAGMVGLILSSFSPALIALSAQVRGYAVLLFCIAGALYWLESAIQRRSEREMAYGSAFLYLAALSDYSAAFVVAALGVYAVAKIAVFRPPWKVIAAWVAGQAGALLIYAFLYRTQISRIPKSELDLWAAPHEDALFHAGKMSLGGFTLHQTLGLFRYFFPEDFLYQGLALLFFAGIVLILASRSFGGTVFRRAWPDALLLVLPFAAVWAAAVAGRYPYSGTRQSAFLAPFAIAGISIALARIYGRRLWAVLAIAFFVSAAALSARATYDPLSVNGNQSRKWMTGAVGYVRESVPRGDPILADVQSAFLMSYYLCAPGEVHPTNSFSKSINAFACGGYSVLSTNDRTWKFTPDNFVSRFEEAANTYHLKPGQRVWVFQAGWGANLDTELPWYVMKYRCLDARSFGANITVFPLVVGPDGSPELPPGSRHLSQLHRCVDGPPTNDAIVNH